MMIETWRARPPFALSQLDRWWLAPRRMFDGDTFHDAPGLLIENGQIATIAPAAAAGRLTAAPACITRRTIPATVSGWSA